jgi:hypothetical protein
MRHLLVTLALGFTLGAPGFVLADRQPKDYRSNEAMTPEQLAAQRARSPTGVNSYGQDAPMRPKRFPWMLVGLAGIAFLVALPFAVRAFRETSRELDPPSTDDSDLL